VWLKKWRNLFSTVLAKKEKDFQQPGRKKFIRKGEEEIYLTCCICILHIYYFARAKLFLSFSLCSRSAALLLTLSIILSGDVCVSVIYSRRESATCRTFVNLALLVTITIITSMKRAQDELLLQRNMFLVYM